MTTVESCAVRSTRTIRLGLTDTPPRTDNTGHRYTPDLMVFTIVQGHQEEAWGVQGGWVTLEGPGDRRTCWERIRVRNLPADLHDLIHAQVKAAG